MDHYYKTRTDWRTAKCSAGFVGAAGVRVKEAAIESGCDTTGVVRVSAHGKVNKYVAVALKLLSPEVGTL